MLELERLIQVRLQTCNILDGEFLFRLKLLPLLDRNILRLLEVRFSAEIDKGLFVGLGGRQIFELAIEAIRVLDPLDNVLGLVSYARTRYPGDAVDRTFNPSSRVFLISSQF